MENVWKHIFTLIGGVLGWVVAEFEPMFPLITIAIIFIVCDSLTAYRLGKRVAVCYPDKSKDPKFSSEAFGKIIKETIPVRLVAIILAFLVEKWVVPHIDTHASGIVAFVICIEQFLSMCENESSCRPESEALFWKILRKIFVDKTERHFNIDIDKLKTEEGKQ